MRTIMLCAAVLIAAAPAAAETQIRSGPSWTGSGGHEMVRVHRDHRGEWRRDGDRDRRRDRFARSYYWDGRDYQGDTLWRPDSFNDWWHERPHRSYPAWVARNQDCRRLWWSGGDWRC